MTSVLVCCSEVALVAGWLMGAAPMPKAHADGSAVMEIVWRIPGSGRGTPAVADGSVYFLSKDHQVVAVAIDSGRIRWTASTGEPGLSTAGARVIATRDVVVAGDTNIVAFDRSGRRRWRFAPADGDRPGLYLGDADATSVLAGSTSGHVFALDAFTGSVRWSAAVAAPEATVFAPVAARDLVLAGFASSNAGGLVALDAATGRPRWRLRWTAEAVSVPALAFGGGPLALDDVVIAVRGDGRIHVVDRESGALRSTWPAVAVGLGGVPMSHDFRPLARSGSLVVAGSLSGTVVAHDLVTGRVRWRQTPQASSVAFGLSSDDHTVFVPFLSGRLVALDRDDGRELGSTAEGVSGFSWVPRLSGGLVFAASSTDGFFAFRAPRKRGR